MAYPLQASTFSTKLPDTENIPLGCGAMEGEDWEVDSQPELNGVALWFEDRPPLVYLTIDALYPGPVLREAAQSALPDVPPENLIFAASHTHAAPMVDTTKPRLGVPDPEHLEKVRLIVQQAARELSDPSRRQPAQIAATKGRADHSVNRRMVKKISIEWPLKFNKFRWAPDFWGLRDETVTVLRIEDLLGQTLATIWNYACHPVMFPLSRTVSTHYIGSVRDRLRHDVGRDVPVLFFQGFSGDIRPMFVAEPRIPEGPRQLYRRLRFGPVWRPEGEEKYRAWVDSLTNRVAEIAKGTSRVPIDGFSAAWTEQPRTDFAEPGGAPVSFQAQALGDQIGIVAVSAEPVVTYSHQARKEFGTPFTMPVGCVDNAVGYLPTKKMLAQGGYEAGVFLPHFELEALSPQVEENTRKALRGVISAVRPSKTGGHR